MPTYVIGDIHGCWDALETLLQQVPLGENDLLITLGDYVDRGPDSASVLDWVIDLYDQSRCIPLRGNHEVMMQAVMEGQMRLEPWLSCGGTETLESYSPTQQKRIPRLSDIPVRHALFLKHQLRAYYETDTHIFVHASAFHSVPMSEQDEHTLYWDRFEDLQPHHSGKTIICGHTAQKSGLPAEMEHAICIDTWVYGKGWLTCLNVETGQYWQANQQQEHRTQWLKSAK